MADAADRGIYAGLFAISLASLAYEILLTRIFSVIMWYHFAFMAISIAMFGLTLGGLIVYQRPEYADPAQARRHMLSSAAGFSGAVIVFFSILPYLPIHARGLWWEPAWMCVAFGLSSVPFVFSGICVCLALTKFPEQVSRLYAADLAGAAVGCILVIYLLDWTDGITSMAAVALLGSVAALIIGGKRGTRARRAARVMVIGLCAFIAVNSFLIRKQAPMLRLRWAKGAREAPPLYSKWNSFSQITISGDPQIDELPVSEGVGPRFKGLIPVRQLFLTIDSSAETTLTGYPQNPNALGFLGADVKELVYWLRPHSSTIIMGAGGGRDVLAALLAREASIRAVEVNPAIIRAVNVRYGDFTGHLDRRPGVRFIKDEARSYIARQHEPAGIIQISFIDTWAATAAGGYTMTENSLYTIEAWKLFLRRLTPTGILSVSRWYFAGWPAQSDRLITLAAASLEQLGVRNTRPHIVLVINIPAISDAPGRPGPGVGTILVSPAPFSRADLDQVESVSSRMGFRVILSPDEEKYPALASLASGNLSPAALARFPFDISPPTDDRPFFFETARLGDLFHISKLGAHAGRRGDESALLVAGLLLLAALLTGLAILVPLDREQGAEALRGNKPLVFYFTGIGLGFMLIEVSQMERLIVFLGDPTYALSVVLFTLLLASGLGSSLTHGISAERLGKSGAGRLVALLVVLAAFGFLTPGVIASFASAGSAARILISAGILFLLGLFMGMAFPLGMQAASRRSLSLTPWLWGINGAASVCGCVLALVIALGAGISASFWCGCGSYAVALSAFAWSSRLPAGRTPGV